jgi:phage tail-like protein
VDRRQVVRFLPDIIGRTMTEGSPLHALAEAMVALLDPVDRRLLRLDHYFDPFRAPSAMLPYLATWVDLDWLGDVGPAGGEGIPPERLRRLIAVAHRLARRRGTPVALETVLRVATGVESVRVKEASRDATVTKPFHLVIELPRSAQTQRRLVEAIVRAEKPIHLTHELAFTVES